MPHDICAHVPDGSYFSRSRYWNGVSWRVWPPLFLPPALTVQEAERANRLIIALEPIELIQELQGPPGFPWAARARKCVSASNAAKATVASSSMSLLTLILRALGQLLQPLVFRVGQTDSHGAHGKPFTNL